MASFILKLTSFINLYIILIFCLGSSYEDLNTMLEIARDVGFPEILSSSWQGNDFCSWDFVTCDSLNTVTIVDFANLGFSGTVSSAFGNLTALRCLYLNDNNLTGVIPDSLTKLTQLENLNLSNNNLSGAIPAFASSVKLVTSPGNPLLLINAAASSSATRNGGNQVSPFMISGIVIAVIAFFALAIFVLFKFKRRRPRNSRRVNDIQKNENQLVKYGNRGHFAGPNVKYSVELLQRVTHNFDENNVVGKGSFGVVYKGELENGTKIAVKRIKVTEMADFRAEVSVLSKARHRHVVSLFGYCISNDEGFLVYEYLPKGTLATHLFEWRERGCPPLTWKQRVSIALDVARGLEYLHNLAEQALCFIHRDLKPSNILIGDDMRAKVSDFGLVKKAPSGKNSLETRVAGTFGYLAPEYAETGKVTRTVDVYALGAILMEMITGKKAIDDAKETEERGWMDIHLVTRFRRVLMNKEIDKEIDQNLNPDSETLNSIYKVAELARHCTASKPRHRPDIGYVVNFLVPLVEQWNPGRQETENHPTTDFIICVPSSENGLPKHVTV